MSSSLTIKNSYNSANVNKFKNSINSSNIARKKNNSNLEIKSFLELYNQNVNEYFSRLDNYDGFFTTQQIESVDFDRFEEHVFFDSAIEKTNYSFRKIFNEYPYDGTEREITNYLNDLDGYTRFILKNKHVKNKSYLRFNGSNFVKLKDRNGWLLSDYKKQIKTGILSLTKNFSFSFDFWINPFSIADAGDALKNEQIILQKKIIIGNTNRSSGYTIYLNNFSANKCTINFLINNSQESQKCSASLDLNTWSHINISFSDNDNTDTFEFRGKFYINSIPVTTSIEGTGINTSFNNDFNNADVFIGVGGAHRVNGSSTDLISSDANKSYNFTGLLDEFRIFAGESRNREVIAVEKDENIFAKDSLRLYYKFNEPSGEYTNNHIVLDHSGNKIHGVIYNNNNSIETKQNVASLRSVYNNIQTPLKYERLEVNPVLFPQFPDSLNIQNKILQSAKQYDLANPNSFWKLLPKNIFIEGSDFDNIDETYISEGKTTVNGENVFGVRSPINQKMINLFSIWARFFDQIKMYIDSITKLIDINYDNLNDNKKIDGILLPLALKLSGFNFREILPYPILEKLNSKNLTHEEVISDISIRQIQNNLWQRFLINSKDILMSKGTISSINSVFNSFGLEASKFISIKEFNGQNKFNIDNNFYTKKINHKEIDFSCGEELFNASTFDNRMLFTTPTYKSDFLKISGEWSVECLYSYPTEKIEAYGLKESLLRLDNILDDNNVTYKRPHINIVFERQNKKNNFGTLKLYINDENDNSKVKIASLENVSLLNGEIHHICLRRKENKNVNSNLSYFEYILSFSSISNNFYSKELDKVSIETKADIASKDGDNSQFSIGFYSEYENSSSASFFSNLSHEVEFSGKISNFRVYSKSFTEDELFLKCKALTTVSLDNETDSAILNIDLFQNLNNIEFDQATNSFKILSLIDLNHSNLTDYNKANLKLGTIITKYEPFKVRKVYSLSQNYEVDFPKSNNFIYINSFESENFKKQYQNNNLTNIPRVTPDYLYSKDIRLSIDFSMVNFLNQDILKIININNLFTEKLSQTSNLYEDTYTDLKSLRNKYFERLEKEIDINEIYQMYKYFDNILEEILFSCIPSKANYKGFNFIYESHALERNKYQYKMVNSNIPVFDIETKYQYHKDHANTVNHRKSDDFRTSHIIKNRM